MKTLDSVVTGSFNRNPFHHQMNKKVPLQAIRPVAHWLLIRYMNFQKLPYPRRVQLVRLIKMAERNEIVLKANKTLSKETFSKLESLKLRKDLARVYSLFESISRINQNWRDRYSTYLIKESDARKKIDGIAKAHIVDGAEREIRHQLGQVLDAIWAYKEMKQ